MDNPETLATLGTEDTRLETLGTEDTRLRQKKRNTGN